MEKTQVKIGDWLSAGFNLYKENFLLLFGTTAIAVILSVFTITILAGPMCAGLYLITFRLIDKSDPRPEVGDLFKGFDYFLSSFLFILVWFIIVQTIGGMILESVPGLGGILRGIFSIGLSTAFFFGLPIITEKKLDFWPASLESVEIVKKNFLMFALFAFILGLITLCGGLLFGIGILLTIPLSITTTAVAYRDICSTEQSTPEPAA